jgi:hypothetical protein
MAFERIPGIEVKKVPTLSNPAIVEFGSAVKVDIRVPYDELPRDVLPNTFYGNNGSDEYIPLFPFETGDYTVSAPTTILFSSAAKAKQYDPADIDTNPNWSAKVSVLDATDGLIYSQDAGGNAITSASLATATISLDDDFVTITPADNADYLIPGSFNQAAALRDIVFVPDGIEDVEDLTGDLVYAGYAKCTIDYSKCPTHTKAFIDLIMNLAAAAGMPAAANFNSRFTIINRTA